MEDQAVVIVVVKTAVVMAEAGEVKIIIQILLQGLEQVELFA
jgi:hypothetical protein